ncbi:MAG: pyridoxal-phosphate dependent enzyme [Acidobacteria bacterium]|nr:pyridoxal-phosphate dependent enzyme [Acidobacteriota bacterium]
MKPLRDAIRPTTLIEGRELTPDRRFALTVVSETLQHTGSFKFRAAYNVVLNVPNDELIAASSGNFGQALAYACRLAGKKCTVVMPGNSARVKVEAVRSYGAAVDLIDTEKVTRAERIKQLAREHPEAYIASAYDDRLVIDGNATLADEIAGIGFDTVVVPVGGGGLISGIIEGFERAQKTVEIVGAEPLLGNDAARSLKAGRIIANDHEPQTIADGARTLSVGINNFAVMRRGVGGIIEVKEARIAEAVRLYYTRCSLKCEPTGALSLAAVLQEPQRFTGKRIAVIVSGGNVDADTYSRLIKS